MHGALIEESESDLASSAPARMLGSRGRRSKVTGLVGAVPTSKQVGVTIIFGVWTPLSTPLLGPQVIPWSYDPTFEPQNPWAQRAMHAMCSDFPIELRVVEYRCWIVNFQEWLEEKQQEKFPSREFDKDLISWYHTDSLTAQADVWFVDGKMKASKFHTWVDMHYLERASRALQHMVFWDQYVDARNEAASLTANHAFHTSGIWVTSEAEEAIISSTEMTIALSAFCGGVGVLAFTGDPCLTVLVLMLVMGIMSGLGFFIVVVMGWKVGPIEIIALVVFIGYSVTYALHVAHSYSRVGEDDHDLKFAQAWEARKRRGGDRGTPPQALDAKTLRFARARVAVLRVGSANCSSAISTMGSSAFLLQCTINIFVKLGAVVIAVTAISLLFALVALPAVLMLVGPSPGPLRKRMQMRCCPQGRG